MTLTRLESAQQSSSRRPKLEGNVLEILRVLKDELARTKKAEPFHSQLVQATPRDELWKLTQRDEVGEPTYGVLPEPEALPPDKHLRERASFLEDACARISRMSDPEVSALYLGIGLGSGYLNLPIRSREQLDRQLGRARKTEAFEVQMATKTSHGDKWRLEVEFPFQFSRGLPVVVCPKIQRSELAKLVHRLLSVQMQRVFR